MSKVLSGKSAVVTGASKGIGAAIAMRLAAAGARVVVNYSATRSGADRVVAAIVASGGTAIAVQADMASPTDIKRLFAEAKKAFGPLDILINNAGVYEFAPLAEVSVAHYRRMFDINVLGLLLASQAALEIIAPAGGAIVNISSIAATTGLKAASVYAGTKGAVDSITRCLAAELGPRGIRVNAINPGMVATEGTQAAGIDDSEMRTDYIAEAALGRVGTPDDIAELALFLASPQSSWITGATHQINGGFR